MNNLLLIGQIFIILSCINTFAASKAPELTKESARFYLPANDWNNTDIYNLKSFILIATSEEKEVSLFEDSSFKKVAYSFKNNKLVGPNIRCDFKVDPPSEKFKSTEQCGYHFCRAIGHVKSVSNSLDSMPTFRDKGSKCENPFLVSNFNYWIGYSRMESIGSPKFLYIPVSGFDFQKQFATVEFKGKTFYFKLSLCHEDDCKIVGNKTSLWEDNWTRMEEHKLKKDLPLLNYLIDKLLPCVVKKDKKCVSEFFLNSVTKHTVGIPPYMEGDFDRGDDLEVQVISDELLEELRACLSYDSLQPHMLSLKGINKVCIPVKDITENDFSKKFNLMIDNVASPEAVRSYVSRDLLYVKGK